MELLDQRWTLLLVRELMSGSERFNDLRRGLPRMSPTLLSTRLHQLVHAGIVDRHGDGPETRYVLSAAGKELRPIVEALGAWGVRWIGELGDVDLDPKLLLWDMRRNVDLAVVPPGRTVVHFDFPGTRPAGRWWLVVTGDDVDVCDADPGHPVDVTVTTPLRTMVAIWRGDASWTGATRSGDLRIDAPSQLARRVPSWFRLSPFAAVPRPPRVAAAGA